MALGAVVLGAALGFASIKFKVEGDPLVEKIEAILPQTQCGQCGFPGCKPYAEAIAKGEVDINLCPPGGMEGVRKLADLLGREVKPLEAEEKPKQVAIIDEHLHRLHAVHPGLPGRCHRRCRQADAHHHRAAVHRLRTVPAALPGRMHPHGADWRNLDNWKWKYPVIEIKTEMRKAAPMMKAA
jgi:electron transport complex protein RnfB